MSGRGTVERTVEAVGSNRLLEESILPTWSNQRAVTFWGFNYIWIGPAVVIATFQYGASDDYPATSLGLNRIYHRGEGFGREKTEEIPTDAVKREDL